LKRELVWLARKSFSRNRADTAHCIVPSLVKVELNTSARKGLKASYGKNGEQETFGESALKKTVIFWKSTVHQIESPFEVFDNGLRHINLLSVASIVVTTFIRPPYNLITKGLSPLRSLMQDRVSADCRLKSKTEIVKFDVLTAIQLRLGKANNLLQLRRLYFPIRFLTFGANRPVLTLVCVKKKV
jgi:hypothetical protein